MNCQRIGVAQINNGADVSWGRSSVPSVISSQYGDEVVLSSRRSRRNKTAFFSNGHNSYVKSPESVNTTSFMFPPKNKQMIDVGYQNSYAPSFRKGYQNYPRIGGLTEKYAEYLNAAKKYPPYGENRCPEKIEQRIYSRYDNEDLNSTGVFENPINEYDQASEQKNLDFEVSRCSTPRSLVNGSEAYYFGVVHLDLELVSRVLKEMPPPAEYFELPAIEKVAYIFYCALYSGPYTNIGEFHKRFNLLFYKFVCSGDSTDLALFKICKSMQDQFNARKFEQSIRAFDEAQHDIQKLDRSSRRVESANSVLSVRNEDLDSVIENRNDCGPMQFSSPHSFATFGIGGKIIVIDANISSTILSLDDARSVFVDDVHTNGLVASLLNLKGPLIVDRTPAHNVRLYIQRRMDFIRMSSNSERDDLIDALLVWQLLDILVQQQGRITGPDVAKLLTNAIQASTGSLWRRKDTSDQIVSKPALDDQTVENFTNLLLGGYIEDALETAMTGGLYAEAMMLVRRLYPDDELRLAAVEMRFLSARCSSHNPFLTLTSVAADQPPPVLTNLPLDDHKIWREHAAIVLANLNSPTAMQTIYHLGLTLAKRGRDCAADFCLLVVCILAKYDPFTPVQNPEHEYRNHISLINTGACVDENESNLPFLISDLQATEIFAFALGLAGIGESPLSRSIGFQLCRIQYAKCLASYGGCASDAFRYLTEIARSIWPNFRMFPSDTLLDLCDIAEKLSYLAAAAPCDLQWVFDLRSKIYDVHVPTYEEMKPNETYEIENTKSEEQLPPVTEEVAAQSVEDLSSPLFEVVTSSHGPVLRTVQPSMDLIPPVPQIEETNKVPNGPEISSVLPVVSHTWEPLAETPSLNIINNTNNISPYRQPVQCAPIFPTASHSVGSREESIKKQNVSQKGWFGSLRDKVFKATTANQMILPDDKSPSIVWDPVKKRYVGMGTELDSQAEVAPPVEEKQSNMSEQNNLRFVRSKGGSRYTQVMPLINSTSSVVPMPPMLPNVTSTVGSFGFIPKSLDIGE